MFRRLAAPLLAIGLALSGASASAAPLTKEQEAQIGPLVRQYLLAHPEVIEEASAVLEARREKARFDKIVADQRHFSIGPKNAKIHIVEFFDYRCGYCKAALTWSMDKIATRKDVRFTFVEFPILTQESLEGSQAAVASIKQGKYLAFHRAMMASKGELKSPEIDAIAKKVGIDVVRLRRDMKDPAIMDLLQANHDIAAESGISGTPAFFINGKYFAGGYKADAMDAAIKTYARATPTKTVLR
jgi:protein-disulfide isomerase